MINQALEMGISAALKRLPIEHRLPETLWERRITEDAAYQTLFGKSAFIASCQKLYPEVSMTEAGNVYDQISGVWNKPKYKGLGIFALIREFVRHHIIMIGNTHHCKNTDFIQWREAIHGIGQTPFICAFLAAQDIEMGKTREMFSFPPYLSTDDFRLRQILAKGVAENHFHLKGSSPAFLNNWVCLMNHSTHRDKEFRELGSQLNNISPTMNWRVLREYVRIAAGLRAILWRRLDDRDYKVPRAFQRGFPCQQDLIDRERSLMPGSLDYTLYVTPSDESPYAGIAGENRFQYRVFRKLFENPEDCKKDAEMFYTYLAAYCLLRSELIQSNNAVGFKNFLLYQDRKEIFIEDYPAYKRSYMKMAFDSAKSSIGMLSVEARISPPKRLKDAIEGYFPYIRQKGTKLCRVCNNYNILRGRCGIPICKNKLEKVFFVVHIPKTKDPYDEYFQSNVNKEKTPLSLPHRHEGFVRKTVNPAVISLIEFRKKHPYVARHIHAIDACSMEIGCRPEVFAPAFRRARGSYSPPALLDPIELSGLHITYHVGEDFLDLCDGLRAIDEAQRFLQLGSADRLGHALALGVSAGDYYKIKNEKVFLPRHDLLDNAVWMEMTRRRFCLTLPDLSNELTKVFHEQFTYIYKTRVPTFEAYFDAWQLRGDDPSYYRINRSDNDFEKFLRTRVCSGYSFESDLRRDETAGEIREKSIGARNLYRRYHYDLDVRIQGNEIYEFDITPQYIHAISLLQREMQKDIARLGIGIECNPSSNYLIGTFKDYKKHPIFTFNNDGLGDGSESALLHVSINTDDLGVFDTNLENEYALIACALREMTDKDGNPRYTPHNIYQYIDNVRQMGVEQSYNLMEYNLTGGAGYDE
jgi:hypothetical protein